MTTADEAAIHQTAFAASRVDRRHSMRRETR